MTDRAPVGFGARARLDATPASGAAAALPEGAVKLDDEIAGSLLPARPARGHKGSFGKLLVIAGSLDYAGAALLVCRAAGRAGAGLVTLAVPESLQPLFAGKVVEATTMALPEDDVEEIDPEPSLARILDHEHDAIVVGPGLRPGLATAELVRELIDIGGQVVVLKGAATVIASPDGELAVAPFENPALASGGTGDVLAGTIGSLLAQGLAPFDAARLGVYLHGLAGDAARERLGDAGVLASDLPDGLAIARKRLAAVAERKGAAKRLGFASRGSTTGSNEAAA